MTLRIFIASRRLRASRKCSSFLPCCAKWRLRWGWTRTNFRNSEARASCSYHRAGCDGMQGLLVRESLGLIEMSGVYALFADVLDYPTPRVFSRARKLSQEVAANDKSRRSLTIIMGNTGATIESRADQRQAVRPKESKDNHYSVPSRNTFAAEITAFSLAIASSTLRVF